MSKVLCCGIFFLFIFIFIFHVTAIVLDFGVYSRVLMEVKGKETTTGGPGACAPGPFAAPAPGHLEPPLTRLVLLGHSLVHPGLMKRETCIGSRDTAPWQRL